MQVLDVALGGTLHQHLPDVVGHEGHHRPSLAIEDAEFNLTLAEGSLAAHAAGREHLTGKSNHHQGIRDLGRGLVVSGWARADGLAVAVEHPGRRFILGVQWHPEVDPDSRLIASLVDAAADARLGVGPRVGTR